MSDPEQDINDIPEQMARMSAGDQQQIQQVWEQYFDRLVRFADKKMPPRLKRLWDGEDVALSALNSFVRGVQRERFPQLDDPSDLWSLLVVITRRKLSFRIRAAGRLKRGGERTRGESVFEAPQGGEQSGVGGIEQVFVGEPGPDEITELSEICNEFLDRLDDDHRQTVEMKMQGYSHDEIGQRLGLSVRTVHRRLQLVRRIWTELASDQQDAD